MQLLLYQNWIIYPSLIKR